MDSSGVGLIMGRYRALGMRSGCMKACHVSGYIEKLLRLSGVSKFLELERTENQISAMRIYRVLCQYILMLH